MKVLRLFRVLDFKWTVILSALSAVTFTLFPEHAIGGIVTTSFLLVNFFDPH